MPLMPIHIEANQVPGIGYTYGGLRMPGTMSGQKGACEQAAEDYFKSGLYWNKFVFTISEENAGVLAIGVDKVDDGNISVADWTVMDNWRIKYYGKEPIDPDAVKGVVSDEINKTNTANNGIYNMLGQRLSKAQRGVNIIGGKKIIKK